MKAPYQGPFEVVERNGSFFKILVRGKQSSVLIKNLKPAVLSKLSLPPTTTCNEESSPPEEKVDKEEVVKTRSRRNVRFKGDNEYIFY